MVSPRVGLSVLLDDDLRAAQLPLFEEGIVEAIEWTIDLEMPAPGWAAPEWVGPLLAAYAAEGALYAHGVHFSPLSAVLEERQRAWLEEARIVVARRAPRHVSEHFGVMTAPGVSRGAPLPQPFTAAVTRVGRDRLAQIADAVERPVGVENLALAMSRDDALAHGDQIGALVADADRFVVLDLHNLFCQAASYDIAPDELLDRMPLERVREVHVSGGSWHAGGDAAARPFRRDTHDGPVPEEVFELARLAVTRCPLLEAIFLERLGGTFGGAVEVEAYRADFRRLVAVAASSRGSDTIREMSTRSSATHGDSLEELAALQRAWIRAVHEGASVDDVVARLMASPLPAAHRAWVAGFDRRAIEVAMAVAKRWVRVEGDAAPVKPAPGSR